MLPTSSLKKDGRTPRCLALWAMFLTSFVLVLYGYATGPDLTSPPPDNDGALAVQHTGPGMPLTRSAQLGAGAVGRASRSAIVTFLDGPSSLPGAVALGGSLQEIFGEPDHGTGGERRPSLLCLFVRNSGQMSSEEYSLTRTALSQVGWTVYEVDPIHGKPADLERSRAGRADWGKTFSKLHVWGLDEFFDKVLYLDADVLPAASGLPAAALAREIRSLLERYDDLAMGYECCDKYNSGVLLLVPSRSLFDRIGEAVLTTPSYDGGDQGFINAFFRGRISWLPFRYNADQRLLVANPHAWEMDDILFIHYSYDKPWKSCLADSEFPGYSEVARVARRRLHLHWKAVFQRVAQRFLDQETARWVGMFANPACERGVSSG